MSLSVTVEANAESKAYFWLATGTAWDHVRTIDRIVKEKRACKPDITDAELLATMDSQKNPQLSLLPAEIGDLYRRSLLVVRTQVDWQGGIVAGNDSDVIRFNRDTYSICMTPKTEPS